MAEGKKPAKGKKTSKKWKSYDTSGKLARKTKFCPKCGPGVFLAQHKNRLSCGKCGYTEFSAKGGSK
jgi:small subunit ribosomal protein S27Ae